MSYLCLFLLVRKSTLFCVFVYDPYVLARTACRLEKLTHITLPDDIQSLIDDVYEERTESGFMQKLKDYSKDGCRQIGLDGSRQLENCAVIASSMDDAVNDSNLSDDLENVFTRYRKIVSQDILLLHPVKVRQIYLFLLCRFLLSELLKLFLLQYVLFCILFSL